MNEILDNKKNCNKKIHVEFSNEIIEIPYENTKNFFKYKIQFWFSFSISLLFILIYALNIMKNNSKEKISKKLLANYNLTTVYQSANSKSQNENHFR